MGAAALTQTVSDRGMQERARTLGKQLMMEDGPSNAARVVDDFIVNELDTGRWKAKFEQHTLQRRELQARKPPGCLAWIARLLCSREPNRFLHQTRVCQMNSRQTATSVMLPRPGTFKAEVPEH